MLSACKPIAKEYCAIYSTLKDAEFYNVEAKWVFELPFRDSRVETKSFTPLNFLYTDAYLM